MEIAGFGRHSASFPSLLSGWRYSDVTKPILEACLPQGVTQPVASK